ncbi:hypothetical protein KEM60_00857 [Austwickia sp. TVS 96-490-7B]|uniref:DUF58 domain-containing protein n=1 Tax=Austwickia sp. TVS 96-490-7B TaxID=2830843 RepID=UPI001C5A01C9|nr:DUF58 domain-containing protein [Austwickia sp. TVS 96-490-7B]MBW3084668.1 hypothetical protein [Austwickia sp. TVS 96-490-7B]
MAVTGRFVALVAAGTALLLIWPQAMLVRGWWVLSVALALLDVALATSPGRLSATRSPVEPVRLGASTRSRLTVTNPTRRQVRMQLRDAWQPSAGAHHDRSQMVLHPGRSATFDVTLTPTRRGDRLTDRLTVRVFGPLGLAARQRSFDVPGVARALPPFHSRKHLPSLLAELRQLDGRSAVRTRGQGTEFDSLRDYVEGDDVRSIDWRASARRQQVVVRTWQPERDRHVVLVLDTSRTSAGRILDMPRLDSAMDAALLLGALASRAGDRVEVLIGDRTVHAQVRTDRRGELLHQLVTAMAPVEPSLVEADWPRLVGAVSARVRRRALVVLLTPLEPAAVEESLLPVLPTLTHHHRVVVASVQDPALAAATLPAQHGTADASPSAFDLTQVYAAAAAEQTIAARAHTAESLNRLNVHVVDEPPDRLPLALCQHYLALKARGLL